MKDVKNLLHFQKTSLCQFSTSIPPYSTLNHPLFSYSHFIFQLIQFSSTVIVIVFSNDTRLASFNIIVYIIIEYN